MAVSVLSREKELERQLEIEKLKAEEPRLRVILIGAIECLVRSYLTLKESQEPFLEVLLLEAVEHLLQSYTTLKRCQDRIRDLRD